MRYVTYEQNGRQSYGVVQGDRVVDLAELLRGQGESNVPATLVDYIAAGEALHRRAAEAVRQARGSAPLSEVRLLAPIPRPRKNVFCLGLNYADHVAEAAAVTSPPMDKPRVFVKVASAVIGPGRPIIRPSTTKQLDYEVELAVVVGERAKAVTRERALGCIAGYTIFNDVSARDLQFARDGGITVGKNFETF